MLQNIKPDTCILTLKVLKLGKALVDFNENYEFLVKQALGFYKIHFFSFRFWCFFIVFFSFPTFSYTQKNPQNIAVANAAPSMAYHVS